MPLNPKAAYRQSESSRPLRLAVIVVFQNEERCLPTFLASLRRQRRPADFLLLVDDGSTDSSPQLAQAYADSSSNVFVYLRPVRPPEKDRLATAAEFKAFQSGIERVTVGWDVIAKIDADLELSPLAFDTIMRAFESDPRLGMAGVALFEHKTDGTLMPMGCVPSPPEHVEGPVKFYRKECWRAIAPLSPILGWDTADEFSARQHGWRTYSLMTPDKPSIHLRTMGTHGNILRSFRRWGVCAWGYGAHPIHTILFAAQLAVRRSPRGLGAAHFLLGWLGAAVRGDPRVDRNLMHEVRREQLAGIRARVRGLPRELATGTRVRRDPNP